MGPDLALGNTGDGITLSTGVTTFGVIPCDQFIDGVSWETGGIGDVTSLGPMTCADPAPHPGYANGGGTLIGTLQRCPNSTDSDNSSADFIVEARTPGAANTCVTSGVDDPETIVVKAFRLRQNQPNPFNPTTAISFSIPKPGRVSLRVYDVQGRIVRTLLDRNVEEPTQTRVVWDGKDDHGIVVKSGVYFYRLEANGMSASRKMVVLR